MKVLIKTILAVTLAALLMVGGAAGVYAAGPGSHQEVHGTISAVEDPLVTITTVKGEDVIVTVTDTTVITKQGVDDPTIGDLAKGDRAIAVYQMVGEDNNAIRIIAKAPLAKHHAYIGILSDWNKGVGFTVTPKKGDAVDILVSDQTKYKVPGVKDAAIDIFEDGDKVAVLAVESDEVITALHVVLIPGKPVFVQRVGTIKDYVEEDYITLDGKKGESTFTVTADTKIMLKMGAEGVVVGQKAVVIAKRVPSSDDYTAKAIITFGDKEK